MFILVATSNILFLCFVAALIHCDQLQRLCRARDLLRDLHNGPRSVKTVARECGFSQFHFIRLFKALFGETPHQYRSRAQIERAKQLLILTDGSVTDVCFDVGFSSLGSFSALFLRHAGLPPSQFQRRYRLARGFPRQLPSILVPGCLSLMGAPGAK
jgi:AraC-like DNA-binding protein